MYQFQALIQKIIQFGNSNLNSFIFFLTPNLERFTELWFFKIYEIFVKFHGKSYKWQDTSKCIGCHKFAIA